MEVYRLTSTQPNSILASLFSHQTMPSLREEVGEKRLVHIQGANLVKSSGPEVQVSLVG